MGYYSDIYGEDAPVTRFRPARRRHRVTSEALGNQGIRVPPVAFKGWQPSCTVHHTISMRMAMITRPWIRNRSGQVVAIAAALLICAVGFCMFVHDQDGGMAPNLCAGMLVSSLALVLLSGPLVNGRLLPDPLRCAYAVLLHIPDPPPKSRWLA